MSTSTSITKSEPILLTGLARSAVLTILGLTGWQASDSTVVLAVTVVAAVLSFGVDFLARATVFSPATVEAIKSDNGSEALLDVVGDLRAKVSQLQAQVAAQHAQPSITVSQVVTDTPDATVDEEPSTEADSHSVDLNIFDDQDSEPVTYQAPVV